MKLDGAPQWYNPSETTERFRQHVIDSSGRVRMNRSNDSGARSARSYGGVKRVRDIMGLKRRVSLGYVGSLLREFLRRAVDSVWVNQPLAVL